VTLARRSLGLPLTMVRHAIVLALVAAAVIAHGQLESVAIGGQPWTWIAGAIGVGVLTAIIGRGLIGAVFVVAGFVLGLYLLLVVRAGTAAATASMLGEDGWLYAAMLVAALVAYLVITLIIGWLRRRS
jgi:hypothetical protein